MSGGVGGPRPAVDLLPFLTADADRLAAVGRFTTEFEVPTCPGWTTGRLIGHVGRVHRWVTAVVAERSPDGTVEADLPEAPRGPEVVDWFEAGAQALLQTLASVDVEEPVWNFFSGDEQPAWLWHRRMAVETAIHRWDGERAVGLADAIDTAVAEAGLREFFAVVFGRAAKGALPGSLHLHRTDGEGEWMVRLGSAGGTVVEVHDKGDCALRGTASELLLFLWNRLPASELEVHGKVEVADAWRRAVVA